MDEIISSDLFPKLIAGKIFGNIRLPTDGIQTVCLDTLGRQSACSTEWTVLFSSPLNRINQHRRRVLWKSQRHFPE